MMDDRESEELKCQIEQTRCNLADKLGALEERVVEPAAAVVTETVTKVKEAVENTAEAVQTTMTKVTETFDFAAHVRNAPWKMMCAAVATGYVLGEFSKAKPSKPHVAKTSVPTPVSAPTESFRSNGRAHTPGPLTKLASEIQGVVVQSIAPILQGLFGAALAEFLRHSNSPPAAMSSGAANASRHGLHDVDHDWAEPEIRNEPEWGARLRATPK